MYSRFWIVPGNIHQALTGTWQEMPTWTCPYSACCMYLTDARPPPQIRQYHLYRSIPTSRCNDSREMSERGECNSPVRSAAIYFALQYFDLWYERAPPQQASPARQRRYCVHHVQMNTFKQRFSQGRGVAVLPQIVLMFHVHTAVEICCTRYSYVRYRYVCTNWY